MMQTPTTENLVNQLSDPESQNAFVSVFEESNRFIVKTATSRSELLNLFKLRHSVFYEELGAEADGHSIDIDSFDIDSEHLIIVEKSSGDIVGTYRLRNDRATNRFYSETEFDIRGFLALPGHKVELGRACIHKDYRRGTVIQLLWRGIAQYLKKVGANYLFGCSSLYGLDDHQLQKLCSQLQEEGRFNLAYGVEPLESLRIGRHGFSPFNLELIQEKTFFGDPIIPPPLLSFYFRVGAEIAGPPAYDAAFKCIDFFTVLKTSVIPELMARKYGGCSTSDFSSSL